MAVAKRLILSSTGFPGTTKTWGYIQDGLSEPIDQLAKLLGEYTILSGLVKVGNNVSSGYVAVAGKIYPVLGGTTALENPKFKHVTVTENALYDVLGVGVGSESLPAYHTEYFQITDENPYAFTLSQLTRLKTYKQLQEALPEKFIVPQSSGTINFVDSEGSYQQKNIPIFNLGDSDYHVTLTVRNTIGGATAIDFLNLTKVAVIVTHKTASQLGIFIDSKGANMDFAVDWEITRTHINE